MTKCCNSANLSLSRIFYVITFNLYSLVFLVLTSWNFRLPLFFLQNALELSRLLPNVVLIEEIPFKLFSHADFTWAINAKTLIYDRVLEIIEKFNVNMTNKWTLLLYHFIKVVMLSLYILIRRFVRRNKFYLCISS